ncbi:MAG: 2-5 ligase [Bacillales bacterium]|jgi:2'-5' RNA ligase|nr:2-5 ligase [Bacillales bacterium]
MEEKALYVIAEFDEVTCEKLKHIEKKLRKNGIFGRQTAGIPYHITIGKYSIDREIEIRRLLADVCKRTEKVDVCFNTIGMFGSEVLFLKPDKCIGLKKLHRSLAKGCIKEHTDWVPHTTLLIDVAEVVQKAIPIVENTFEPFIGRINSISLYELFPAQLVEKVELKELNL